MNIILIDLHLICVKDNSVGEVRHSFFFFVLVFNIWVLDKDSANDEYICVQTLDGVLFVFEYERQSMVKSLPNTYLPGPLCYLSRLDAFLTVSSNYHLECYK